MTANATRDESDDEALPGFDPARALSAIRRRWRLVVMVALAVSVTATLVALLLPNRYEAVVTVQIDPRRKAATPAETPAMDLKPDNATLDSEIEVIRSRDVLIRAIDALQLRSDPEFNGSAGLLGGIKARWSELLRRYGGVTPPDNAQRDKTEAELDAIAHILAEPNAAGAAQFPTRDEIAGAVLERLKVARVRQTMLLEIRFTSSQAAKSARIANAVAEAYLDDQLAQKKHAAKQSAGLLEEKLASMRLKVAEAERHVEVYKAEHGIFDGEGGHGLTEKELNRQMEQLVAARTQTGEARARYEQAQKLMHTREGSATLSEVLSSSTIRHLKDQLNAGLRRSAELRTKYGPNHPEMRKAEADVREAQGALDAEVERVVANLKNDLDVAVERQRQTEAALSAAKAQQAVSKEAGLDLKELQREALSSKQLYEALLARHKQMTETIGLQLPDSRVVESAQVPLKPSFPKRRLIILAGLVGGILAGLGLSLAIELTAPGIDRAEDVEHLLDISHLTSLPAIAPPEPGFADPLRLARLVVADPGGTFAEAIRSVRREVDVRRADPRPRVVLVAASMPGEGATDIASNLAHHYALTGSNVLLVDGDLRRANLSRMLASSRTSGLLEALATGQRATHAILRDATTGLNFLPATGSAPARLSSPELLASPRLAEVFADLKRHFDTIVVEAPPLLPVIDGRILADHADQIVLVVAWRRTPKQMARRALKSLGHNQRKVLGALVTEVDADVLAEDMGQAPAHGQLRLDWAA
jgi:capsular exopolysaccharide synthesis family protein